MQSTNSFRKVALTGALLALSGAFVPARAQEPEPDDLKRGVARISVINGDVNVRRGDTGEWVAGVVNAPLLSDDHIATGPNSRAEIQFDANNVLRLGANAELRLSQVEYGRYQMDLARGLVTYRLLRAADANVEIDTPSVSVRPSKPGSVRISVAESGETEVTARSGDVEIFTPKGTQWIRSGQAMVARGSASDPEFQLVAAAPVDEWDGWSDSRDRGLLQSTSARYVGQGIYGAEELDNSGTWNNVPEYGNVWTPTVSADWSPYYNGRWTWADWYGWTWVSYDPWGWAPYHYGRWFHHDRIGWCWYPGEFGSRHYWSPALVGFFGFGGGGGFGYGFGYGNVGWVALGPRDAFRPWWGRSYYGSRNYNNRQVNFTNVNITNVYQNGRVRNGINSVGARDFEGGRFNNVQRLQGSQVHDAGQVQGQMPFAPGRQNLRFTDRNASNVPRISAMDNTRFVRQQTPSSAQRVPLSQQVGVPSQQRGVQANQGRVQGVDNSNGGSFRRFGSPSGPSQNAGPQTAPGVDRSVDRNGFGTRAISPQGNSVQRNDRTQPSVQPSMQQSPQAQPRNDNRGGWNRFGTPGSAPVNNDQPRQSAPRGREQQFQQREQQVVPRNNFNIAPPVVRERPSYNQAPRQMQNYSQPERQSQPRYSQPSQPSYSRPSYSPPQRQSAPSYSAPRSNGGGGGSSAPRGNSGGGSSQSGGGNHRGR